MAIPHVHRFGARTLLAACVVAGAELVAGEQPNGVTSFGETFPAAQLEFFESKIRPILVERCHECHAAETQEGNLRLDSRAAILTGGDTGPAIESGNVDGSLLIDAIRYGEVYQMPPTEQLPAEEIALLEEWIRLGAPWTPGEAVQPVTAAPIFDLQQRRRDHWAWRPIAAPPTPPPAEDPAPTSPGARSASKGETVSPIDAFLHSKRAIAGLQPAGPANKRALLRRATFDLLGLPPTPDELAAFEADASLLAFATVVDRLLASPHFGERWARHWLDLVRYSETLGHEFDYPLTNAWRYRDYVIRALNADVPYDQFVREHVAGDLLAPPRLHPVEGFNESVIATAFWYFGEAVHAPVDSRADQAARVDNQLDVLSKAFLGLTVACARCHDHKFDAISTRDYYALAGYAASSHQQDVLLDVGGQIERGAQRLAELHVQGRAAWTAFVAQGGDEAVADAVARGLLASLAAREVTDAAVLAEIARHHDVDLAMLDRFLAACTEPAAEHPGHPLYAWNVLTRASDDPFDARRRALAAANARQEPAALDHGPSVFADFDHGDSGFDDWRATGWAFGQTPTRPGDWLAAAAGPEFLPAGVAHSGRLGAHLQGALRSPTFTIEKPYVHYRLYGRQAKVRLVVDGYAMDKFSMLLFEGLSFDVDNAGPVQWHVQSTARHLGHRAHIELIDAGEGFIAVDEIRFADSPTPGAAHDDSTSRLLAHPGIDSPELLARAYGAAWAQSLAAWRGGESIAAAEPARWALSRQLLPLDPRLWERFDENCREALAVDAAIPAPEKAVAIADGSGVDWPVFIRGNYKTLGAPAPRRFLEAIAGADQPPAPASSSGRLELADRLLATDNPFPARVMANRVWAHLMGQGIVATVDNFGVLGEAPTHPVLLDYLATRLQDGWSVKRLSREIMLTEAYQMTSVGIPSNDLQDPGNRLWHRANVRRLEGEAIRDALLAVSGRLDATPFGPPVPIHLTPFMEGRGRPTESGPLDGGGRRTIYVEVRRNFLSPLLLAFDTPPPASCVGRRNVSNVPAQALTLMNDPLVADLCRSWAQRLLAGAPASPQERVTQLYLAAFGRPPTAEELAAAEEFLEQQSDLYDASLDDGRVWADFCHVLVNVKEFIFIP